MKNPFRKSNFEVAIHSLMQLALVIQKEYEDDLSYFANEQLDNVCYHLQELVDNDNKFKE